MVISALHWQRTPPRRFMDCRMASSSGLLHAGDYPGPLPGHGAVMQSMADSANCCWGVLLFVHVCFTLHTSCWWLLVVVASVGKRGARYCAPCSAIALAKTSAGQLVSQQPFWHIWVCRGEHPGLSHNFKPTFYPIFKQAESTHIWSRREKKLLCAWRRACLLLPKSVSVS